MKFSFASSSQVLSLRAVADSETASQLHPLRRAMACPQSNPADLRTDVSPDSEKTERQNREVRSEDFRAWSKFKTADLFAYSIKLNVVFMHISGVFKGLYS